MQSSMTTSKLTPEDVAWLEQRLSYAIAHDPVAPRREFVDRARESLRTVEPMQPLPRWVKPSALAAVVLSLLALVGTLFYLHSRDTSR